MENLLAPGLHIVATPIGNLCDISARAADTLRNADLILAEDTRVTAKLLAHIKSKTPMLRYDDHSSEAERDRILGRLGGEAISPVSDAGTPLISHPGHKSAPAPRASGPQVPTGPPPAAPNPPLPPSRPPPHRPLLPS